MARSPKPLYRVSEQANPAGFCGERKFALTVRRLSEPKPLTAIRCSPRRASADHPALITPSGAPDQKLYESRGRAAPGLRNHARSGRHGSSAINTSARLLPEAGGDLMSRHCSPRFCQTRSCMGRMPNELERVELPSWAYLTETEGMEIGLIMRSNQIGKRNNYALRLPSPPVLRGRRVGDDGAGRD